MNKKEMICKNCPHGESFHKHRKSEGISAWDGRAWWYDVWGYCMMPDCDCKMFKYPPRKHDEDGVMFKPEQIKLNEELRKKDKDVSRIVIDKDFHELFCTILKEETNRTCDCEGTTSEIRNRDKK